MDGQDIRIVEPENVFIRFVVPGEKGCFASGDFHQFDKCVALVGGTLRNQVVNAFAGKDAGGRCDFFKEFQQLFFRRFMVSGRTVMDCQRIRCV